MWPGHADHMMWMSLWWIVGLALFLLLIWVVARAGTASRPPGAEDSPEMILKRRYARGEIDQQEYERRLSGIRKEA